jgi:hypothetical protein
MSLTADWHSCPRSMARPTGRGCSPSVRVRVPHEIMDTMKAVAILKRTTISAVARDALNTIFAGLVDDLAIDAELERRKAALGRGEGA